MLEVTFGKNIRRYVFTLVVFVIAFYGALTSAQEVASNENPPLWLMSCSNQLNAAVLTCEFSQSIVIAEGNQRLATISFVKDQGKDQVQAFILAPVGVSLKEGVKVLIDGKEIKKIDFSTCVAQGCQAVSGVDAAWLSAMRGGLQMTLVVMTTDKASVELQFQLRGFAQTEKLLP